MSVREVYREELDARWCFRCRTRSAFVLTVTGPGGVSYYGPVPSVRCATCGALDGDLFPGGHREWEG